MAVGEEQLFQLINLPLQLAALVGVADSHAVARQLHNLSGGNNVSTVADSFLRRSKRLVLHQLKTAGVEYKRVAGNACGGMVSLGEAAVYHHKLASGTDRRLAFGELHRHVTVDYMPVRPCHAKLIQNHITYFRTVTHVVIVALLFVESSLVGKEVALESSHFRFVEQRRIGAAPQIPVKVGDIAAVVDQMYRS